MAASGEGLFYFQQGNGHPLLLLHGLLVDGRLFEPLVERLHGRHRVIVPDLRGHGRSQHLPPAASTQQYAADLLQLLDALAVPQVDVVGYSQGGTVAQQLAYAAPQRVRRLALVCTFAFNRITWREKLEARLLPLLLRMMGTGGMAALVAGSVPQLLPHQRQALRQMIAAHGQVQAQAALHALHEFDSRPWLSRLTCPILIIAGERDTAVPLHHARLLHAAMPHARLHILPEATHSLLWTHTPALADLLLAFSDAATPP